MKRVLIIIVFLLVFISTPYASCLTGEIFHVTCGDHKYELVFIESPFSGGEGGYVEIRDNGKILSTLSYTITNCCLLSIGKLNFVLIGNQLKHIPEDSLTFTKNE